MSPKTSARGGKTGGRGPEMTSARITVLALAILTLVFIFENNAATEIRLLVPVVTMPLWVALLATGVAGALCGAFFACYRKRRR